MTSKIVALTLCLVLGGCSFLPKTTIVKVPVIQKCTAKVPESPVLKYKPPYTELFELVKDLKIDRAAMMGYEIELKSALESCLVE